MYLWKLNDTTHTHCAMRYAVLLIEDEETSEGKEGKQRPASATGGIGID